MKKAVLLSTLLGAIGLPSCLGVIDSDKFSVGDAGPADAGGDADSDGDSDSIVDEWVGAPCDPAEEEYCADISGEFGAFCLVWDGSPKGFCTVDCQPATLDTPVDGCQGQGVVCSDITDIVPDYPGVGICLQECVPESNGNPCKADYIRCDPQSWAWESQFATCLLPACFSDMECMVPTSDTCSNSNDCLAEAGERCEAGECYMQGTCNKATGRCGWQGRAGAEIGDPCASSRECGKNMVCLTESTDGYGKVVARNGYCSKTGCKAANIAAQNGSGSNEIGIQEEFGCGVEGVCHTAFSYGGYCLRACDPANTDADLTCRQPVWDSDAQDRNGDYECQDQSAWGIFINAEGNETMYEIANGPFCIWVSAGTGAKCSAGLVEGASAEESCESLYAMKKSGAFYGLGMSCRDPNTGEPDPNGYCLDETTSGPTMTW